MHEDLEPLVYIIILTDCIATVQSGIYFESISLVFQRAY